MTKWEYKIAVKRDANQLAEWLNEFGKEGWEMVCWEVDYLKWRMYHFKRPVDEHARARKQEAERSAHLTHLENTGHG